MHGPQNRLISATLCGPWCSLISATGRGSFLPLLVIPSTGSFQSLSMAPSTRSFLLPSMGPNAGSFQPLSMVPSAGSFLPLSGFNLFPPWIRCKTFIQSITTNSLLAGVLLYPHTENKGGHTHSKFWQMLDITHDQVYSRQFTLGKPWLHNLVTKY